MVNGYLARSGDNDAVSKFFDDYLDPNAFIVSSMQGSITQLRGPGGSTYGIPKYWNGDKRVLWAPIRVLEELYSQSERGQAAKLSVFGARLAALQG